MSKFTGKNAVCEESSATAYGVFDCEFYYDSHDWSCSKRAKITGRNGEAIEGEKSERRILQMARQTHRRSRERRVAASMPPLSVYLNIPCCLQTEQRPYPIGAVGKADVRIVDLTGGLVAWAKLHPSFPVY